MEIGNESINIAVLVTGINKDFSPVTARFDFALCTGCFQSTDASGAYCYNTSAGCLSPVDCFCSFRSNSIELTVHLMVLHHCFANRPKGTKTNMESNKDLFHALVLNPLQ